MDDQEQQIINAGQAELMKKRAAACHQPEMPRMAQVIRLVAPGNIQSLSPETSSSRTELKSSSPDEHYDVAVNIERILLARGVPENFVSAKLERPELIDENMGYFFHGPCGAGKTYRAVAIMREIIICKSKAYRIADIVRGIYNARFIAVTSLLLWIKSSFSQDAEESEGELIERLSGPALLVLDDMGAEKVTEWTLQTLYTIIDIRSREKKQTIITSNLSLDELSRRLSDRISSRIRGMCKVITVAGKDRRLERGRE